MGNGANGQTGTGNTSTKQNFEKILMSTTTTKVLDRRSIRSKKKKFDLKKFETSFSCGAYYCACLYEGNVYLWGSYQDPSNPNNLRLISNVPQLVSNTTMMQVKQIATHKNQLFAVVGLSNLPNIRFSSFDPPVVESGTLEGIIDYLLQDFDDDFTDVFFITYTLFMNGAQLLDYIEKKVNNIQNHDDPSSYKTKLILFIEKWVKSKQNFDVFESENIFEKVTKLIEMITASNNTFQTKILKLLAKENTTYKPPPSFDRDLTEEMFEMNPRDVAEQISLVEQHIFSFITGSEFLKVKWQKNKEQAQNIIRVINFFNNFSNWCSTTILQISDEKVRSKRANCWLSIADVKFHLFYFFFFFLIFLPKIYFICFFFCF